MTKCANCGRELPDGALFCPDCGVKPGDFTAAQSDFSPSHFNSGTTSTSPPQMSAPVDDGGFATPPSPSPEEARRPSSSGRKRLVLAVIAILAVLLVATSFESGLLGTGAGSSPVVNSARTPFTGQQLYAAYASNQSQADAAYTNKTIFIQDSLDFGVTQDFNSGQYFSSVNSGTVILVWNNQTQVSQLNQGSTVLAKCSVEGAVFSPGTGYQVYLQDCELVNVQSLSATTTTASVPVASL